MVRIKLFLQNIEQGLGVTKGYYQHILTPFKYNPQNAFRWSVGEKLATYIKEEDFDAVGLTEVDANIRKSGKTQFEYITDTTGMHGQFFQTYKNFMITQGNSVLTKWPIIKIIDEKLVGKGQERHISGFTGIIEKKEITLLVTHLALGKKTRSAQLEHILRIVHTIDTPCIIAGDFNTQNPEELAILVKGGLQDITHAKTYPSWNPEKCFDHIFISKGISRIDVRAPYIIISDHIGVIAELELE